MRPARQNCFGRSRLMPDVLDVNQAEQKIRTSVPNYTQSACHERVFFLFFFYRWKVFGDPRRRAREALASAVHHFGLPTCLLPTLINKLLVSRFHSSVLETMFYSYELNAFRAFVAAYCGEEGGGGGARLDFLSVVVSSPPAVSQ